MLIPWRTDAPVYHWPIVTVGLILVNAAVFAVMGDHLKEAADWMLWHGLGLHPLQWITSNFMHADVLHLLGNMIFLWSFGLIVEGKVGWWRFLAIYLGIGAAHAGVLQFLTQWGDPSFSLGASAAICGLMAIALVWAPENEISCIGFFTFRPWLFDVRISVFAAIYLALQIGMAVLTHAAISTPVLHISGAVWGFAVGIALLKLDWVDCENWDLFAVLAGRKGQSAKISRKPPDADELAREKEAKRAAAREIMAQQIADGKPQAAMNIYQRFASLPGGWDIPEEELLRLIVALHRAEAWKRSIEPMVDYLRRFPEKGVKMRLKLAQILIHRENRPRQALRVLGNLPAGLPGELDQLRRKLEHEANHLPDPEAELEAQIGEPPVAVHERAA